jgi:hypothetical protein
VVRAALVLRASLVVAMVLMIAMAFGVVFEVALWHLCLRLRRATSSL